MTSPGILGPTKTALITDSNAQLPDALVERYGITTVALTVTVDGVAYREGAELSADDFYAAFAERTPEVASAAPSPGQFLQAYRACAEAGAASVLAVLLGSEYSGTVNAANLAAGRSPIPVQVVDTHTASFGISFAAWAAADCLHGGGSVEAAAAAAATECSKVDNVFTIKAIDLARAGGRVVVDTAAVESGTIPLLRHHRGQTEVVGQVGNVDEAAEQMAAIVCRGAAPRSVRAAVGVADAAAAPLWQALEARLQAAPEIDEVLRYRIGPSVGVHTGPGTAGVFYVRQP